MLIEADYEVVVVTRLFKLQKEIEADGVRIIDLPFSRPSLNPIGELGILRSLRKIYQAEKPDLVFHVAFKPVLIGSLAALGKTIPRRVNAIAGMGQLFLKKSLKIRLIRLLVMTILRFLFRNRSNQLIVQNRIDLEFLRKRLNLSADQLHLIRGVGVDIDKFVPTEKTNPIPVVSLVARLIKEKGVLELVEAARILRSRGVKARIWLVGEPDKDSPEQITETELQKWESEKLIEWKGFQNDIRQVYADSDIAVLPSYSEGLPKSLLEACASGLPIVTTDNGGCLEVVDDGINGLIVPSQNSERLADTLATLIGDRQLRIQYGLASRERAQKEFSLSLVLAQVRTACGI